MAKVMELECGFSTFMALNSGQHPTAGSKHYPGFLGHNREQRRNRHEFTWSGVWTHLSTCLLDLKSSTWTAKLTRLIVLSWHSRFHLRFVWQILPENLANVLYLLRGWAIVLYRVTVLYYYMTLNILLYSIRNRECVINSWKWMFVVCECFVFPVCSAALWGEAAVLEMSELLQAVL